MSKNFILVGFILLVILAVYTFTLYHSPTSKMRRIEHPVFLAWKLIDSIPEKSFKEYGSTLYNPDLVSIRRKIILSMCREGFLEYALLINKCPFYSTIVPLGNCYLSDLVFHLEKGDWNRSLQVVERVESLLTSANIKELFSVSPDVVMPTIQVLKEYIRRIKKNLLEQNTAAVEGLIQKIIECMDHEYEYRQLERVIELYHGLKDAGKILELIITTSPKPEKILSQMGESWKVLSTYLEGEHQDQEFIERFYQTISDSMKKIGKLGQSETSPMFVKPLCSYLKHLFQSSEKAQFNDLVNDYVCEAERGPWRVNYLFEHLSTILPKEDFRKLLENFLKLDKSPGDDQENEYRSSVHDFSRIHLARIGVCQYLEQDFTEYRKLYKDDSLPSGADDPPPDPPSDMSDLDIDLLDPVLDLQPPYSLKKNEYFYLKCFDYYFDLGNRKEAVESLLTAIGMSLRTSGDKDYCDFYLNNLEYRLSRLKVTESDLHEFDFKDPQWGFFLPEFYLKEKNFKKAFSLAIRLAEPGYQYHIVLELLKNGESESAFQLIKYIPDVEYRKAACALYLLNVSGKISDYPALAKEISVLCQVE